MATWIDTHTHLDDPRFDADRAGVIARMAGAGVTAALVVGVDLPTSRRAVELAHTYDNLYAVVGIQPNYAAEADPADFAAIEALLDDPRVVAVGETGLDRYWDRTPWEVQVEYFERHLALARRRSLPVVVHCRDAGPETAAVLESAARAGPVAGVMHSYSGDVDTARRCLAAGLHVSFAGMVTYKTAVPLREVVKVVPRDRILVETDCPYLAPVPKRGSRNEPGYVVHTGQLLAGVRGESIEALAATTTANARKLFRLENPAPA